MINNSETKKKFVSNWFVFLQSQILKQFQDFEKEFSKSKKDKVRRFIKKKWNKNNISEGGGTYFILKNGKVFDKVGINQSTVSGTFKKEFRSKILGAAKNGRYWASGISVVAHMKNPKIPALHFNTRFIVTEKEWFGGGMDATPCISNKKESLKIHQKLKKICESNKKNYKFYKNWCDKYFYLAHHQETRGIGGIFFDYENKNWFENFKFVRDLGIGFLDITNVLIKTKQNLSWKALEKNKQLLKRAKYIQFNILYDRGTKFGLNSGGDLEAILMSLPPNAKWK
tara:strand:+ start:2879 stop:3730 length:852 start_codon:yes stop_codon:yes gene_type:complete